MKDDQIIHMSDKTDLAGINLLFGDLAAVHKQMAIAVAPMVQAAEALREAMKPMVEIIEATHKLMKPVATWIELNRPVFELAAISTINFLGDMAVAAENMERWQTFLTEKVQADHIFLSPFFMNFTFRELTDVFCQDERSAIEIIDEYFSKPENIELLKAEWTRDELLEPRMQILSDALDAHLDRTFTLSIPAFLAQLDGVFQEILGVSRHHQFPNKIKNLIAEKKPPFESHFDELNGIKLLPTIVEDHVFAQDRRAELTYPNRHSVLHGNNLSYFKDRYYSVRCILLLDLMRSRHLRNSDEDLYEAG